MEAADRRLHMPDDPVVANVLSEAMFGIGGPSARPSSYSMADETFLEESMPRLPRQADGIEVPPILNAANVNVSWTKEAAREVVAENGTLLWESNANGGPRLPGTLLLFPMEICSGNGEQPNPIRLKIERLEMLGRLA